MQPSPRSNAFWPRHRVAPARTAVNSFIERVSGTATMNVANLTISVTPNPANVCHRRDPAVHSNGELSQWLDCGCHADATWSSSTRQSAPSI